MKIFKHYMQPGDILTEFGPRGIIEIVIDFINCISSADGLEYFLLWNMEEPITCARVITTDGDCFLDDQYLHDFVVKTLKWTREELELESVFEF